MIISFFFSLLLGALAGYVAGRLMGSRTSALRNVVLGILGSIVGTFLFNLIGLWSPGRLVLSSPPWWAPASVSGWNGKFPTEKSICIRKARRLRSLRAFCIGAETRALSSLS